MLLVISLVGLLKIAAADGAVVLTSSNIQSLTRPGVHPEGAPRDWLIEFHTPKCTNCDNLHAHFDVLAAELPGDINVGKADVLEHQDIGLLYEVSRIPTVLLLHFEPGDAVPLVYRYSGPRKLDLLRDFATGGYKSVRPDPRARARSETSVGDLVLGPVRIALSQAREGAYTSLVLVSIPAITLLYMLMVAFRVRTKTADSGASVDQCKKEE
jgi:thiol-disulfide isomerase/thioredoxin